MTRSHSASDASLLPYRPPPAQTRPRSSTDASQPFPRFLLHPATSAPRHDSDTSLPPPNYVHPTEHTFHRDSDASIHTPPNLHTPGPSSSAQHTPNQPRHWADLLDPVFLDEDASPDPGTSSHDPHSHADAHDPESESQRSSYRRVQSATPLLPASPPSEREHNWLGAVSGLSIRQGFRRSSSEVGGEGVDEEDGGLGIRLVGEGEREGEGAQGRREREW